MRKALIIQTAFLGDVILATPVIEKLKSTFPEVEIDFLLKKGNQPLLDHHPHLRQVLLFDKSRKLSSMYELVGQIRKEKYDLVINLQRFLSSGLMAVLSGAPTIVGFDKNPMSFLYHKKYAHRFEPDSMLHEVERNLTLLAEITDDRMVMPKLYPSANDFEATRRPNPYVCIAPASVWHTKQWPADKWIKLIDALPDHLEVLLLGSNQDSELCEFIRTRSQHHQVENIAGKNSLLQVAALLSKAKMNYVNDSAPLHIASAMNAPVTAVFCSTIPGFGFYPLSDDSHIAETREPLSCRPCGIHGRKKCPEGHFNCTKIDLKPLVDRVR